MFKLPFSAKRINQLEVTCSRVEPNLILATIYRHQSIHKRFDVTNPTAILQLAHMGFRKNQTVTAHSHNPIKRETVGTSEIWIVTKGQIEFAVYDVDNSILHLATLKKNDVVVFQAGGHALKAVSHNSEIYEIKNGPYGGATIDKQQI